MALALVLGAGQAARAAEPVAMSANRTVYEEIRDGKVEAVLAQMPANANTPSTAGAIAKLHALVPPGQPRSSTLIASPSVETPDGRAQAMVVEYDYPDRTIRFETAFEQPKGKTAWTLRSFQLKMATRKELAPNTLSLADRSLVQLAYFALAVASPLLMLAALIKVLRTPNLPNRWLWSAFALVGLFSFNMNWASGGLLVDWMALRVIGFWITAGPSKFVPAVISATVPIGAMLILAGLVAKPTKA